MRRPVTSSPQANDVLKNYGAIRTNFRKQVLSGQQVQRQHVGNAQGFFRGDGAFNLQERYGGFDKLFHTLILGVVDDPDYALKKDNKIYQRMLRDPQIYYCLEVRKKATSALPWTVSAPEGFTKDKAAMKLAAEALKRIKRIPRFNELLNNIQSALLPGLSINELTWEVDDNGKYIVNNHYPMNKDRFKFDAYGNLRLLQPVSTVTGSSVPPYKFITHTFNVTDGSWHRPEEAGYVYYGQGLADTPLYHYFYFKVTAMRFLLKSLERHGHPFKIFYTGGGNPALMSALNNIMLALQNDSVVAVPGKFGETRVDVPQSRGKTEGNMFMGFMDYVDKLITRAILLQDLMTEMPASGGSYALGAVHESVFAKVAETDKQLVEGTLNRTLMEFDAELNTPQVSREMRPVFVFKKGTVQDPGGFLTMVQSALNMGLTISESQVRELTGLKKPEEEDDEISSMKLQEMQHEMQERFGPSPEEQAQQLQEQQAQQQPQGASKLANQVPKKPSKGAGKANQAQPPVLKGSPVKAKV